MYFGFGRMYSIWFNTKNKSSINVFPSCGHLDFPFHWFLGGLSFNPRPFPVKEFFFEVQNWLRHMRHTMSRTRFLNRKSRRSVNHLSGIWKKKQSVFTFLNSPWDKVHAVLNKNSSRNYEEVLSTVCFFDRWPQTECKVTFNICCFWHLLPYGFLCSFTHMVVEEFWPIWKWLKKL